jgi:hypothetical protein
MEMEAGVPSCAHMDAMSSEEYNAYELTVRRSARNQGLELRKSRSYDFRTDERARYTLLGVEETRTGEWRTRALISSRRGLALEEVHRLLLSADGTRRKNPQSN